jgi:DNA-binding NarL/FixJ family response regulator
MDQTTRSAPVQRTVTGGLASRAGIDPMAPSVLIVDDHEMFRARATALVRAAGYEVVGEAGGRCRRDHRVRAPAPPTARMAARLTQTLRLIIADDPLLLREGIATVLAARGFEVVAQASDGDELVRKVIGNKPDVALVDIRMSPTGTDEGLRAAEQIANRQPEVGVVILSDYLEPEYATRLLESGTPGRGYLLKETVTDR